MLLTFCLFSGGGKFSDTSCILDFALADIDPQFVPASSRVRRFSNLQPIQNTRATRIKIIQHEELFEHSKPTRFETHILSHALNFKQKEHFGHMAF